MLKAFLYESFLYASSCFFLSLSFSLRPPRTKSWNIYLPLSLSRSLFHPRRKTVEIAIALWLCWSFVLSLSRTLSLYIQHKLSVCVRSTIIRSELLPCYPLLLPHRLPACPLAYPADDKLEVRLWYEFHTIEREKNIVTIVCTDEGTQHLRN